MNVYYEPSYLQHHGVKGMKWGVRRYQNKDGSLTPAGRKRHAKQEYRQAKAEARSKRSAAISKADSNYEKATSKRVNALKKVDDDYATKRKTIDTHYKSEIDKHQQKADKAKRDMDFWGEESMFYKDAFVRYNQHAKDVSDTYSRYDAAVAANKIARDQAAVKVRELYYNSDEKAAATREAAYAKAGSEYVKSMQLAKMTYKDAKKKAKSG